MAAYPRCPMCGATGPVGATHTHCACVSKAVFAIYIKPPEEMISMATEETPATAPIAVTAEILVPMERIVNCLIGAFEGGSTYWLRQIEYVEGSANGEYENPRYSDEHYWNDGGRANLSYDNPEESEDEDGDQVTKEIGTSELTAGLSIMAVKHPRHFGDLIAENDDAITHDVFIQCVLMGDTVYG